MQSAPIPQTLLDVRPVVRNMRPEGYILQTGGSATRQEIKMEGSQTDPLFRVTGVPLHTHNATALLEVDMIQMSETIDADSRFISGASEFSVDDLSLDVGDFAEGYAEGLDDEERLQRSIEFGVGTVKLRPENCVNYISEPTRAIAEIRTLVCSADALKTMTYVDQKFAYTDRKGNGVDVDFPQTVSVPVLPVSNMHVESKFASRLLAETDEQLHLEFFQAGYDDQNIDSRMHTEVYNNWTDPSNSYASIKDNNEDEQKKQDLPFPVGFVQVGTGNPVQIRLKGSAEYVDWDGRLPYVYNGDGGYVFDGPVRLKFRNFRCTSNGHLHQHTLLNGTDEQKKQINVFNPVVAGDAIEYTVTRAPDTVRHDGFFYVFDRHGYDNPPSRSDGRYRKPRAIIQGNWQTSEQDRGAGVTTFRTAADHNQVYTDLFFKAQTCWHAPMIRWAVGSDVPLSGPMLTKMNLDGTLNAQTGYYNPTDDSLKAYTSAFETFENAMPLLREKTTGITSAADLEALVQVVAPSSTRYLQIANGTLDDKQDEANEAWGAAFPVPFRAGLYPFPEDHRFPHQASQQLAGIALAQITTNVDSVEFNLHVPEGQQGDISRKAGLEYAWALEADFATNGSNSNDLLKLIGHYEDRANILAKMHQTGRDYSLVSAQEAYEDKITEGTLATGESALSLVWASEFVSDAGHRRVCPCELLVANPEVTYAKPPADGSAVELRFQLDQYPFFRTSFGRSGLRYRGGYHVNSAQADPAAQPRWQNPHQPCVGNVFAYGLDPANDAPGAVGSVRDGANVEMYVQVMVAPGGDNKRGILRVTGLAFDPSLNARTLIIYYGGDGGNADKQLYWSEPGVRKTVLNEAAAVGDQSAAIAHGCWITDIYVQSHDAVTVKARTKVVNGDVHSHLYVAIIAPRAEGMFSRPDEDSVMSRTLAASLDTGRIYAPRFVVTQPLTAPIISPDFRNGCIEPLDQMTAFLPPELRDFGLQLGGMDWRHVSDRNFQVNVKRLIFSEFNGGNQQVAALPSLLSVPEFREHKVYLTGPGRIVQSAPFDTEIFSPMGPPCFWCIFARADESPNYGRQPVVDNLAITCMTTGKKSDTVQGAGQAELFFMTRRNCHKNANYTDDAFKQRQVILLRSEDVGTMGISPRLFQREKRVRYRIQGTVHWAEDSTVHVILAYTNRGLQISGKEISVQYL